MKMSDFMPGQPEAASTEPVGPDKMMSNLRADLLARNAQPTNPMTNTGMPDSLEQALLVIEDQKRIIQTLQAKNNSSSSQREMR